MATDLTVNSDPLIALLTEAQSAGSESSPEWGAMYADLCRACRCAFSVIDIEMGEVVYRPAGEPLVAWENQIELCREVYRRGRPELVFESEPLLAIASPLFCADEGLLAVALLVESPRALDESLAPAAEQLDVDRDELARWARRQEPKSPESLLHLASLVVDKVRAERQVVALNRDVEDVTSHLLANYEEITLLHRLTQELKISCGEDRLGAMALEWLADAVPAECLAIYFNRDAQPKSSAVPSGSSKTLFHGQRLLNETEVETLISDYGANVEGPPIVLNHTSRSKKSWPFPNVDAMIITPMADGDSVFGWLLALNHNGGGEFGPVEASLLSSVAAILGIHSGNLFHYREQSELLAGVVRALTSAIDAKDPYTKGHSDRVARVAVRLAQELGLDDETLNTVYLAGLLHDIGKIGIDDNVLRKPGKLTEAEYEHIKLHPELGYRILKGIKRLGNVLPAVLHHHEAWNGKGYPHQLSEESIPLIARIVAVADSYDAIASDRPYRRGMSTEKLEEIFRGGAGSQWDPQVVAAYFSASCEIHEIAGRSEVSEEPVLEQLT